MTHQSGQLFLKEEREWDQEQLKAIRLSFLSYCILKILIVANSGKLPMKLSLPGVFLTIQMEVDPPTILPYIAMPGLTTDRLRHKCRCCKGAAKKEEIQF